MWLISLYLIWMQRALVFFPYQLAIKLLAVLPGQTTLRERSEGKPEWIAPGSLSAFKTSGMGAPGGSVS